MFYSGKSGYLIFYKILHHREFNDLLSTGPGLLKAHNLISLQVEDNSN